MPGREGFGLRRGGQKIRGQGSWGGVRLGVRFADKETDLFGRNARTRRQTSSGGMREECVDKETDLFGRNAG
jgi:hypothetical protein